MIRTYLALLGFFIMILFVSTGCQCISSGVFSSDSKGYIRPLAPGHPKRVLGRYSGKPDLDGIVTVRAVGKGIPPANAISKGQAVLMAERAAIADAYRKIAEKIYGLYVQAYLKMGNEVIDYDLIQVETATWLRGIEILNIKEVDYGITEADAQVKIHISPDHILKVSGTENAAPVRTAYKAPNAER